jgi:hypothetical protein
MGELEPWMDENFIKGVFLSSAGENVNVKVIRDKNSGYVIFSSLHDMSRCGSANLLTFVLS